MLVAIGKIVDVILTVMVVSFAPLKEKAGITGNVVSVAARAFLWGHVTCNYIGKWSTDKQSSIE
jgi:hypothetical protein